MFSLSTVNNNTEAGAGGGRERWDVPTFSTSAPYSHISQGLPKSSPTSQGDFRLGQAHPLREGQSLCANLGTSTVFQSVARLCSLNALWAHKALNTKMCEISSPKDFSGPRAVTFTGSTHPETQQMLGEHPWGPRGGQSKSQHSQNHSQARSRRGIRSLPRPRLSAKFGTAARGGRALGN